MNNVFGWCRWSSLFLLFSSSAFALTVRRVSKLVAFPMTPRPELWIRLSLKQEDFLLFPDIFLTRWATQCISMSGCLTFIQRSSSSISNRFRFLNREVMIYRWIIMINNPPVLPNAQIWKDITHFVIFHLWVRMIFWNNVLFI